MAIQAKQLNVFTLINSKRRRKLTAAFDALTTVVFVSIIYGCFVRLVAAHGDSRL